MVLVGELGDDAVAAGETGVEEVDGGLGLLNWSSEIGGPNATGTDTVGQTIS